MGEETKAFPFFFQAIIVLSGCNMRRYALYPDHKYFIPGTVMYTVLRGCNMGRYAGFVLGLSLGLRLHKSLSLGLDLSLALFLRLGEVWSRAWN